jgi:CRP-like cAMP-binding protein
MLCGTRLPLQNGIFKNSILKNLDAEAVARLHLRPVTFEMEHEIEFPGNPIEHLFFVEEGMASMTTTFQDGSQVEVGMFGYEGVIGVSALMGTKRSLNRVFTQIPGRGYSCTVEAGKEEFKRNGGFQSIALRYVQAQLILATQSVGCNAKHELDQRLARWLLLCADRAHSNTYKLSQEFIADMLGCTRPTVSVAAGLLKDDHVIEYSRGLIQILDVARLEKRACECYQVIKNHLDNYTEFDSGMNAEELSRTR